LPLTPITAAGESTAEPEEIADGILFLSCVESAFVTGSTLAVDGRRTFHQAHRT